MSKIARAVIGANYGDEGKGLLTDYLTAKYEIPIVIRHNGGAQAGHTVFSPVPHIGGNARTLFGGGASHVFHHFGAGTFAGAVTFLSKYFILNPITFNQEHKVLRELGYHPEVFVDKHAILTTPYDMICNQALELFRQGHSESHHGSCGLGINETVVRNHDSQYGFQVHDIIKPNGEFNATKFRHLLEKIHDDWVPTRLSPEVLDFAIDNRLYSPVASQTIEATIEDYDRFFQNVTIVDQNFLRGYDSILFEGAQLAAARSSGENVCSAAGGRDTARRRQQR